jgi:hypothetical protein
MCSLWLAFPPDLPSDSARHMSFVPYFVRG